MKKTIIGIVLSVFVSGGVYAKSYIVDIPDELVPACETVVANMNVEGNKNDAVNYINIKNVDEYLSTICTVAARSWAGKQKEDEEIKLRDAFRSLTPEQQASMAQQVIQLAGDV